MTHQRPDGAGSVADLVADPRAGTADVAVDPDRAQGALPARVRRAGRRLHAQRHLAGPGDPRGAGPAGRGDAWSTSPSRTGVDAALARRGRAERRGRRRRRDAGRGAGRRVVHLPLRRRPGRDLLVPLAPGLARAGAARAVRRARRRPRGRRPATCATAGRPARLRRQAHHQRLDRRRASWTPQPGRPVRVRVVNTDNGAASVWVSGAPYRVLAVDGHDVHGPTPVSRPRRAAHRRRPGRPRGRPRRPGVELGRGECRWSSGARRAARARSRPTQAGPADLRHARAAAASTRHAADRRFDYSIGRRPGFLDGRPGLWWSINGHLFPDVPMFVVDEGDVVRMTIEQPQRRRAPDAPARPPRRRPGRNGVTATGSPWWVDSLDVANGDDLRDRVRRRQPRHLDGPLPQPAARGRRGWSRT